MVYKRAHVCFLHVLPLQSAHKHKSVDICTTKMELTCPAGLGDVDHVEDDDLARVGVLCGAVRRLPISCTVLVYYLC